MADRSDLINQLAASMGAGKFASQSMEETRFDAQTGTLYCNGMVISQSIAEKAIQHFELLEKKCDVSDSSQRQMAMIYRCAVESIKLMKNPKIKSILQEEVNAKQSDI